MNSSRSPTTSWRVSSEGGLVIVILFVLGVVGVTSCGAWWITRHVAASPASPALAFLELVGMCVLFFLLNVGVALSLLLALRLFASVFVSLYILNDVSLLAVSVFQGLFFAARWR